MNTYKFTLLDAHLEARASRTLWWPDERLLCVSDLHLGKSDRISRRSGTILPPYENQDTMERLGNEIRATGAMRVVCLGDSFDDTVAADRLDEGTRAGLSDLASRIDWVWIAGNHDPAIRGLPGAWHDEIAIGPLRFRHIATPMEIGEISGHYHPKARLPLRGAGPARACFLIDGARVVMPAFGTYTGGLASTAPELCALMSADARAVLTGPNAHAVPMPRVKTRGRATAF